jgi:purine-binding chemotaxis protein CheW
VTDRRASGSILLFELGAAGSTGIALRPAGGTPARPRSAGIKGATPGLFGIEVDRLVQVIEPEGLTPVPLAPAVVLGIVSFHGRIVTVVNPAPILGLDHPVIAGPESRILLLRDGRSQGGHVGLWVTRVHNIVPAADLGDTDIQCGPCVRVVAKQGDRLANIIDVEPLLLGLAREFGSSAGQAPRQGVAG